MAPAHHTLKRRSGTAGRVTGLLAAALGLSATVAAPNGGAPAAWDLVRIHTADTPGQATDIEVVDPVAYVADGDGGLAILDLTTPATPTVLGGLPLGGYIGDVNVYGSRMYLADDYAADSGRVHIVDISQVGAPALMGTYTTTGRALGVWASAGYALVANNDNGLLILDVSQAANPHAVGGYDTPGRAMSVQTVGSLVYVADGTDGLQIIDVSSPASPTVVGTYPSGDFTIALQVAGDRAYLADGDAGLQILDVSQPASPTLLGALDTPGDVVGVFVEGDTAYLADYGGGVRVVDVSVPAAPTLMGHYQPGGSVTHVQPVGDVIFVAGGSAGVHVLRFGSVYRLFVPWVGRP
jgi:hypothetical protein